MNKKLIKKLIYCFKSLKSHFNVILQYASFRFETFASHLKLFDQPFMKSTTIPLKIVLAHSLKNQKGMALVETIPILVIFLVLIAYGFGFFGVVHTGILNSIAARAYAFETFRNRNNVTFFRDRDTSGGITHFANMGTRFHTVNSERMVGSNATLSGQFATTRPIAFGRAPAQIPATEAVHNERIYSIERRNRRGGVGVSPAWIMVGYGICINARCGD